jgi:hypothetical protein
MEVWSGTPTGESGLRWFVEHCAGDLSIETDLRVTASVGAPAVVVNDRPGIDGNWVIATAHHTLNRGGGGQSSFQLKRPGGSADTDSRSASKASSTTTSAPSNVAIRRFGLIGHQKVPLAKDRARVDAFTPFSPI